MDLNSFSFLDKVFNITQYNRGKLGEVAKLHEKNAEGNWYFIQTGQSISSVIVPLPEFKKLVEMREKLEKLANYSLYMDTVERLGTQEKALGIAEIMKNFGLDPGEIVTLEETVEFE